VATSSPFLDGAPIDRRSDVEARAKLVRGILEAVPGGVVHVALDGSIIEANSEALRFLGLATVGALDGVGCTEVPRHSVLDDVEATTLREDGLPCPVSEHPIARVLAAGEAQPPVTIGMRQKDGAISWALFRSVPTRDAQGNVSGAIATFIDVTERKRADDELRRSEATWRALAQNLPDFVVIVNREARIQWISHLLPHHRLENVIGTQSYTYIAPDYLDEWRTRFETALETREVIRFDTCSTSPTGTRIWYETTFVPIIEAPGTRVEHLLMVARDITTRRTMTARLAEKERLASIGMLSASVAHEIMNPLTSVLANLDFALSDRCPPGARKTKALLDAREGAARMQQIVWDLRALGRTGTEDLFYVDVRSVIETALRLVGPDVAKNVAVKVDLPEVPGVLASESRLCQVFINLLINAAQAMVDRPTDERTIIVRTHSDDDANLVGVDISDTGSGITPENLGRIFDPFFTTKPTGTGLGLSISKESLERMGGRLEVRSEAGVGTTFTVWLSTTRVPARGAAPPPPSR
jgi:two-component system, cell cycle sensor histidine kinase and response regulator CckA